jgi:hypothetical protein
MKSVAKVFPGEANLDPLLQALGDGGIEQDRIQVIDDETIARDVLDCKPACMVRRYGLIGIALGAGVYLVFALIAGWCQCMLFKFDFVIGAGAFLGGLLAGVFVGGLLGALTGLGMYEDANHQYIEKVQMGNRVVIVQASRREADKVRQLLDLSL